MTFLIFMFRTPRNHAIVSMMCLVILFEISPNTGSAHVFRAVKNYRTRLNLRLCGGGLEAIQERIQAIEYEMSRTQKNKATEGHLGLLKGRLARLRTQLLEPTASGPKGEGFAVEKFGDARVAMVGFPSVGKSTLLSTLTGTASTAVSLIVTYPLEAHTTAAA
jgi:hypothetical protein